MEEKDNALLAKSKEKLEKGREFSLKNANSAIRELSKSLIIASSILVGLISALLGNEEIRSNVNNLGKGFFLSSWLFLIISIFLGISQFFVDYKFANSWVRVRSQIIRNITNKEYKEYDDFRKDSIEKQGKLKNRSSMIPTIFQVIFILLGLISIGLFVYFKLFCY